MPAFVDSVFEPWVSQNRGFTPVTIVIQQLLVCSDVSGCHQDQMRGSINGVKPGLAVSTFTVVNESSKTACFLCSVHTVDFSDTLHFNMKVRSGQYEGFFLLHF